MIYRENPKLKGSGILSCIPQRSKCTRQCDDCFFQGGRSYLEPLRDNLPNVPSFDRSIGRVVRMNDGHDSNLERALVVATAHQYVDAFFNTASPHDLEGFPGPVVLTVNPGSMTDTRFLRVQTVPRNLMFVRVRTNTWNTENVDEAVDWYTSRDVPVVLTFMAYFKTKPSPGYVKDYMLRKRTSNDYLAITSKAWRRVMKRYEYNILVSSCGKIEGEKGDTHCRYCGVCLREYFATTERLDYVGCSSIRDD